MKFTGVFAGTFFLSLLMAGAGAHAAQVTGTVTDKTTGKPATGDQVVLVDVQAGMNEVARATTDASGHYALSEPGNGPYLIRVTHQGAGYFIAAPQGGGPGDIPVFDVAAKVRGVMIEADVIEAETDPGGQLKVNERYFVHNTSSPPITQWSPKSFEIVLPPDAVVTDTGAQRPSGLPTSTKLDADGPQGHYSFNFPIQPDDGDKDTLFQVSYTLPYADGKYTFNSMLTLPADHFAILLPKSMNFAPAAGLDFKPVTEDPGVLTFLANNVAPGKAIEFTISGTGAIPRESQNAAGGQGDNNGGQDAGAQGNGPGGGIGTPINTPDPLSKYKWWILGGLTLLLAAAAAFLLRRPAGALAGVPQQTAAPFAAPPAVAYSAPASAGKNTALLNALKEELFAIESEKIAGTLPLGEYGEVKAALETVLRRALKKQ
ncbi:MAG: carboxypeptidase-like regulatory domain-containing protein [Terracidiphilus sp.]